MISKYADFDHVNSQGSDNNLDNDDEISYKFRPALGSYWHSVPTHRFLITPVDPNPMKNVDSEINSLKRKIVLTKSSCIKSGMQTMRDVLICDQGVVDDVHISSK